MTACTISRWCSAAGNVSAAGPSLEVRVLALPTGSFAREKLALGVLDLRFHAGGNETILGIEPHVSAFEIVDVAACAMQ
jgi:hypothetical protein